MRLGTHSSISQVVRPCDAWELESTLRRNSPVEGVAFMEKVDLHYI